LASALQLLDLKWSDLEMMDEPPGVFSRIEIPAKLAAHLPGAKEGQRASLLLNLPPRQLFSKKRQWDRAVLGKLTIREITTRSVGP
jgi:hypothetical protein